MRKLVTVRKVEELRPIDGADLIEAVRVDGWWCVVKKGEFKVGDLGIYFEIDSLIPTYQKQFAFLKNGIRYDGKDYYRIRTVKLRGQISQGLLIPLASVPISVEAAAELYAFGEDMSDFFGVIKWEPPVSANLAGQIRGNFPHFIPKTDQERVQNCYNHIVKYVGDEEEFEASIKLEGSSCTMYFHNGTFGVCSRNLELADTEGNAFWSTAHKYKWPELLALYGKNIAVQAELIGEGVQDNHEKIKGLELHVFDIFDIDTQKYLAPKDRWTVFQDLVNLQFKMDPGLPRILHAKFEVVKLKKQLPSLDDILKYADGPSVYNKKSREGIVFKQMTPPTGNPFSFKAISNEYLLEKKQ